MPTPDQKNNDYRQGFIEAVCRYTGIPHPPAISPTTEATLGDIPEYFGDAA